MAAWEGIRGYDLVHVDPDGATAGADFVRGEKDVEASAAAQIDHRLSL
jgi:hypothetical protein